MTTIKDTTKLIETAGNVADELVTSDAEERQLLLDAHRADMQSDSWLSKNIRPLFLVFSCAGWLIVTVLGSFENITIPAEAISVLKVWGEFAIAFYFGSRGWHHVERVRMKRDIVNGRIERKKARQDARAERRKR